MTFKRTRCPHCKGKLEQGQRIHPECIDAHADEVAAKLQRAEEKAKRMAAKVERAETRKKLEGLKRLNDLHREAQAEVNEWIRWRDRGQPCISCGKPLPTEAVGGGFDAGHYLSRGAAPHLRYDVDNIHGQCKQCNRYGAGMAPAYRVGLIDRLGVGIVEVLEANRARVHKWQHDEVREIRDRYRAINRENRRSK